MKIKQDFVTNSSSTSFTFVFKGTTRNDLFEQLYKNKEEFNLEYDTWDDRLFKMEVWDIISTILGFIKKDKYDRYYKPDIYPVASLVEYIEKEIQDMKKYIQDTDDGNKSMISYYDSDINKREKDLKEINRLIDTGEIFSTFELSFGNDGVVSGDLGTVMEMECVWDDYENKEFFIVRDSQH